MKKTQKFDEQLAELDVLAAKEKLPIARLWLAVQPAAHLLARVRAMCWRLLSFEAESGGVIKGGALINVIHDFCLSEGLIIFKAVSGLFAKFYRFG